MQVHILSILTAAPCVGPELHANSEGRISFMGLNRPRYSITEAAYEEIDLHNFKMSPEVFQPLLELGAGSIFFG
jgi:hypothetical protein